MSADSLAEIAVAQAELNAVDDQLSAAIGVIEHALTQRISTRVGIEVANESFTGISFGKTGGGWRILVEQGGHSAPLLGASREVRARSLSGGHLARLLSESAACIRAQIADRRAASDAASFLMTLLANQQETNHER